VGVFGEGFGCEAADLIQRTATQDRAGAAEGGGVPEVVALLQDAVEELAFGGDAAELAEVYNTTLTGIITRNSAADLSHITNPFFLGKRQLANFGTNLHADQT